MSALLALAALPAPAPAALSGSPEIIEGGHVDFNFCNSGEGWSVGLIWDRDGNPVGGEPATGILRPSSMGVLIGKDRPYEEGGNRVLRPAGDAVWSFTGVGDEEPLWWFPQNNWSGVWPGFNVCVECGVSYFEEDPRINAEGAWKVVQLLDVKYRGLGSGHYSAWSTDTFGGIVKWMSTADGGITDDDQYFVGPAGHSHPAMGFSSPGLYEVTFNITCYDGPGKTNPDTSPAVTYYFAIGTYWEWVARNFRPAQWSLSDLSGENADADGDGVPNLMEYACGLNPRVSDPRPWTPEEPTGLPALIPDNWGELSLRFPLRPPESRPQIRYVLKATPNPAMPVWPDTISLPPTPPRESDAAWTDIMVTPPPPQTGAQRRFFRVEATLLPDPADS